MRAESKALWVAAGVMVIGPVLVLLIASWVHHREVVIILISKTFYLIAGIMAIIMYAFLWLALQERLESRFRRNDERRIH